MQNIFFYIKKNVLHNFSIMNFEERDILIQIIRADVQNVVVLGDMSFIKGKIT